MALVKRGICEITALNSKGSGTCTSDTFSHLIELPYTIPGETVEFEEHSYRNKTTFLLSKILKPSEHRAIPPCQYFGICGGCLLQHLDEDYYLQYKLSSLSDLIGQSIQKVDPPIKSGDDNGIKILSIGSKSRRRAIFEAVKKEDHIFFGFKKYHSNKIVNIDHCLLLLPELSSLIEKLKIMLLEFLDDKEKCRILVTKATNGIDLTIEIAASHQDIKPLQNFAINNSLIKLTLIENNKWHLVHFTEQPYILFENTKVAIDNHSFLQASESSDKILANLVNNILGSITLKHSLYTSSTSKFVRRTEVQELYIADLFCGRGTLTIPAAKFGRVDGYETEKASVKALGGAINDSKLNASVTQRDLFTQPLQWDELTRYDAVIINPPRAGAQNQSAILGTSTVRVIIYLSCNPETFARDAEAILKNKRYILQEIIPIDQFYWSPHLELMGVFIATGQ